MTRLGEEEEHQTPKTGRQVLAEQITSEGHRESLVLKHLVPSHTSDARVFSLSTFILLHIK